MKNAIYYSVAAAFAEEVGAARVVGGHNRDDRAVFEDTSDEFFSNLQRTLRCRARARLREQDCQDLEAAPGDEQGRGGRAGVEARGPSARHLELPQGGNCALLGVRRVPREGAGVRAGGGRRPAERQKRPKGYKTGSAGQIHASRKGARTNGLPGPSSWTSWPTRRVEPAEVVVDAGVADLQVLYHNGKISIPVFLTIQTSTGSTGGST